MKKFLMILVAAVMLSPVVAQAKINLYGQLDLLGYATDGIRPYAGYTGDSKTYIRAFVGANFELQENIEGNIALLYGRYWGETGTTGKDINTALDKIRIAEANIVFKNLFDNDKISAKVGRYFYGEKGDSIFYIDLRDLIFYNPSSLSRIDIYKESGMDGLLVTYDDREKLKVDAGYSKLSNNIDNAYKRSLFFVNAKYQFNDMINLRGYVYDFEYYHTPLKLRERYEYIGLKPEVKLLDNALAVSLEVAQMFWDDETPDNKARMFQDYAEGYLAKLDAKYAVNEALNVRGMYLRTGKKFYSEYNDVYVGLWTSWSSLTGGLRNDDTLNIGGDYTLNKFIFSADYFRFVNIYYAHDYPHYEIDVIAAYNYTDNIVFKAGAGFFSDEQGDDSTYVIYTFGATWKFGESK